MKTALNDNEIKFTKNGHATDATICLRYAGSALQYLACTYAESRWFKTLKGAIKYMNARGYEIA